MSDPYVGEIRMFAGNYPPVGWSFCDGQLTAIGDAEALFNLIGTTYGGDGQSTFALPDLRGRLPVHMGTGPGLSPRTPGEVLGAESATITTATMPAHSHTPQAAGGAATSPTPSAGVWASVSTGAAYAGFPATVPMNPSLVGPVGGNQPHENLMPALCVSFIIAMYGVYPSPS